MDTIMMAVCEEDEGAKARRCRKQAYPGANDPGRRGPLAHTQALEMLVRAPDLSSHRVSAVFLANSNGFPIPTFHPNALSHLLHLVQNPPLFLFLQKMQNRATMNLPCNSAQI